MDVTFQVRLWCPPAPAESELDSLLAAVRMDTIKPAPEMLQRTETSFRWRTWDMDIEPLRSWGRDGTVHSSEDYGVLASESLTYGGSATEGETTPAGMLEYYLVQDIDYSDDVSIGGRVLFEHREAWGDYSDPNDPQSGSNRLGWHWVGGYTTGTIDISALRSE